MNQAAEAYAAVSGKMHPIVNHFGEVLNININDLSFDEDLVIDEMDVGEGKESKNKKLHLWMTRSIYNLDEDEDKERAVALITLLSDEDDFDLGGSIHKMSIFW